MYRVDSADNGGVHSNSGIPNQAFAILVDGGKLGTTSVTGIGPTKVVPAISSA